jgi:dienelactone hydrolase
MDFERPDGTTVPGVILGTGGRGVVLANMSDDFSDTGLCDWMMYAPELAEAGYRVAVFNYSESEEDQDVQAAVAALRERGATKVALVGASMGGTVSLSAAAQLDPAPDAIVALSPPTEFRGVDAVAPAKKVTIPSLFVVANGDTQFVAPTKALHKASAAKDKKLTVVEGPSHGIALMLDPAVKDEVIAFVDKHTK